MLQLGDPRSGSAEGGLPQRIQHGRDDGRQRVRHGAVDDQDQWPLQLIAVAVHGGARAATCRYS